MHGEEGPQGGQQGGHDLRGYSHLSPRRLIYLSCGFPALMRDARVLLGARLSAGGYNDIKEGEVAGLELQQGAVASGGDDALTTGGSKSKSARRRARRKRVNKGKEGGSATEPGGGMLSGLLEDEGKGRAKWRLVSASAHLFFPGTDSIETLCVFEEVL